MADAAEADLAKRGVRFFVMARELVLRDVANDEGGDVEAGDGDWHAEDNVDDGDGEHAGGGEDVSSIFVLAINDTQDADSIVDNIVAAAAGDDEVCDSFAHVRVYEPLRFNILWQNGCCTTTVTKITMKLWCKMVVGVFVVVVKMTHPLLL